MSPSSSARADAPRVVHLTTPAPFGGLEKVVHALAGAQHRAGIPVHAIVLHGTTVPEPPLAAALRAEGLDVVTLSLPNRAYRAQLAAVRDACARLGADVVHSHGYHADVLSAMLGRRTRMARVATVHGFTGGGWKNRLYERAQCRAYARFDAVIAVSRKLRGDLEARGVAADRLRVLPNAWAAPCAPRDAESARRDLGIPADAFSLGWVGRVSHEKGLDVLVEALPALEDLPLLLTVLGDGAQRAAVAARATALGVAERIAWKGAVPDAASLLPAFDLLVLSSRTEGTPMVLLEAMSAGVPVLTTSVGGIPDMVSPAEALLVPAERPAALEEAIREAWLDPDGRRARAARAAARLAADFAIGPWLDAHDDIYRAARARAARGAR